MRSLGPRADDRTGAVLVFRPVSSQPTSSSPPETARPCKTGLVVERSPLEAHVRIARHRRPDRRRRHGVREVGRRLAASGRPPLKEPGRVTKCALQRAARAATPMGGQDRPARVLASPIDLTNVRFGASYTQLRRLGSAAAFRMMEPNLFTRWSVACFCGNVYVAPPCRCSVCGRTFSSESMNELRLRASRTWQPEEPTARAGFEGLYSPAKRG